MTMTKKEKARLESAERIAAVAKEIGRLFVDLVKEDLEEIARDAASEIADDLTISH